MPSSYGTIVLLYLILPPAAQALQLSKPQMPLPCGHSRCLPPRLMSRQGSNGEEDASSEAARLRKVADTAGMECITAASSEATAALDELQSGFKKRLEAMGAAETVAPPTAPPSRSVFGISNASAHTKAAEEALYRMRMKDNGLLEAENAESIRKAQRAAKQWLDAGLSERAKSELERVQPFCSYKTEVGAEFHLLLASIQGLCGQTAQARRTLQRIARDAETSTQRWQAERQLESSASSRGMKLPPPTETSQYSDLFQMPEWD